MWFFWPTAFWGLTLLLKQQQVIRRICHTNSVNLPVNTSWEIRQSRTNWREFLWNNTWSAFLQSEIVCKFYIGIQVGAFSEQFISTITKLWPRSYLSIFVWKRTIFFPRFVLPSTRVRWTRSPKTHRFKNDPQSRDFWRRQLLVYLWTDEKGGFFNTMMS